MRFFRRRVMFFCALGVFLAVGTFLIQADDVAKPGKLDNEAIGKAAGATAATTPDGVVKVTWPRKDIPVQIEGLRMPPFMGLTSWAAFSAGGKQQAMVMGDLVLFQDEVNPALDEALAGDIAVTALHNHFFFDEPRVFFMHIGGEGDATDMAASVREILDRVAEVRSKSPKIASSFASQPLAEKSSIDTAAVAEILGGKPAEKEGMCKFTFGRTVKMPCGCEVGKEMGVNTWAAFYGTADNALVDGDFATFAGELQTVLRTLRAHKINIVAIHSHMEGESPRVIFLHYWGRGPANELANGVKAALDAQAKVSPGD